MQTARAQIEAQFQEQLDAYLALRDLWRSDPERYCRQRLGLKPTWQQQKILQAIAPPGAKVTIRSGHNIGKDAITAGIILWFMEVHSFPRVACTAPTGHQLYDVLWGELAKWMRRSEAVSRARGDWPRFWLSNLFKLVQDRLYDLSAPVEWYAVARTARKENPEALAGLHASDLDLDEAGATIVRHGDASLLYVIDEASGVPDPIYENAEGALASPDCRSLQIGNPTRNTGYFAASHKQHRGEYTALHFRSQDSPLVDTGYRARLVRKFGEGSNVVRVRADGEFPRADDDTLIPLEYCEAALERQLAEVPVPVGKRRMGIDPAWTGVDRATYVCRQGHIVPHIAVHRKLEPMEGVGYAMQYAEAWDIDEIYVDVIGMGAGWYSRLDELHREGKLKAKVFAVNVAESAPPAKDKDAQPRTMRDYLWLEMRRWLRDEPVVFAAEREYCEDLAGELSSPKLLPPDSDGRLRVESKDDMKRRLKSAGSTADIPNSPDIADGLGCTFHAPKKAPAVGPTGDTQPNRWSL